MFVHLHTKSWFSFLEGASSPEALVDRAKGLGMESLALTDRHGVYGIVRFQKACRAAGIKPIVGAEVMVNGTPLVLIARSAKGYSNLCQIITAAHLASREHPTATFDDLAGHAEGLFCLTGGRDGYAYRAIRHGRTDKARAWLSRLRELFLDHLYVELVHYLRPGDTALVDRLFDLAVQISLPVVAAGDVLYARQEEYKLHDLLTCIRLGIAVYDRHPKRPVNGELYLKPETLLRRRIPYATAFENACMIADACEVDLLPGHVTPPSAILPDGRSPREHLVERCVEALIERYPIGEQERALSQLRKELRVIGDLELEEYFLTVHEVTEESRRRGIRCAGRGSAANSIVAYLLDITGVDPLKHRLLFERFLHGGRKGTPDIDVDFDAERREEIIAWIEDRFGIESTAMTATVITYQLRLAIRDVSKALGWPPEVVDQLAQAVPPRRAREVWSYSDRLREIVGESALFDSLLVMVAALDGCPRHLGLHVGGMVLSREPLHHFTPVQVSANGVKSTQFDKDDVEALGLIKFDVLGLRMLAAISEAVELVERSTGEQIDIDNVPLDDVATFNMIRSGRTLGVFQIESQGQMHLLAETQPECFDDLIAEIALFRPGPLQGGMVNPFVRRRRGIEPVEYEHLSLELVLRDTYGVILFQEQVLEVAHTFAGMSLQEADDFRSLMSKFRDRQEMEGMRSKFVTGAVHKGVAEEIANSVFDKVSNFVGYGFCRSHAAAFAKTVYQSAWLKCHHPAAFMAAIMQHRPGMYNLTTLEQEAGRLGVLVLFPDINRSGIRYELESLDGRFAIRKSLSAVTALSVEDARKIVLERLREPFKSVEDLYTRVDLSRDVLENLARSAALDELVGSSRRALWEIGVLASKFERAGTTPPLSLVELPALEEADVPELPPLAELERLRWDYQAQGSARRHPMTLVRRTLNMLEVRPVSICSRFLRSRLRPPSSKLTLTMAGIVILRQMPPTANGVLFVTLEDESGLVQCIVLSHVREEYDAVFRQPSMIVRGKVQIMGNWRGLIVLEAWPLGSMLGGYRGHASANGGQDRQFNGVNGIAKNHPKIDM